MEMPRVQGHQTYVGYGAVLSCSVPLAPPIAATASKTKSLNFIGWHTIRVPRHGQAR
jgi:hypothetical protein